MRILFCILLLCLTLTARATIHTAASVDRNDVGAAYALCVSGDVLAIPAGTANWQYSLKVTNNITIRGAGTNVTVIYEAITNNPSGYFDQAIIEFSTSNDQYQPVLEGITFRNGGSHSGNLWISGAIQIWGSATNTVIRNCELVDLNNEYVAVWGGFGLCVSNRFTMTASAPLAHFFRFYESGLYGGSYGNGSWEHPSALGSAEYFYVENCLLEHWNSATHTVNDGFGGSRFVFRNNIIKERGMAHHGTESTQIYRSPRWVEIYRNTLVRTNGSNAQDFYDMRDGNGMVWGNTMTGAFWSFMSLDTYRFYLGFPPWGYPDGTKSWDQNDPMGVFDSGTTTSGSGTLVVEDTSKSWTTNQWAVKGGVYVARLVYTNTATSGGSSSAVVTGAGWTTNQWTGWEITKVSNNSKGVISGNTSDTLTFDSNYYKPSFSGGGQFVLSYSGGVYSNSATKLYIYDQNSYVVSHVFPSGYSYEIRRVLRALDQTGMGICSNAMPVGTSLLDAGNTNPNQQPEPSYFFNNTWNGSAVTSASIHKLNLLSDRDYFTSTNDTFNGSSGVGSGTKSQMLAITPTTTNVAYWVTDEGSWDTTLPANTSGQLYKWDGSAWNLYYTPYTYPHPLTLIADTNALSGASISPTSATHVLGAAADTFTATFSTGVADWYQWTINGVAVSGANSSSYAPLFDTAGTYLINFYATNSYGPNLTNSVAATNIITSPTPASQRAVQARVLQIGR